jgi:hypothetical protein
MARIKTTRTVKAALWTLRIYLLILLTLIGIKFARVFSSTQKPDATSSTPATIVPASTNPPVILKKTSASLQ